MLYIMLENYQLLDGYEFLMNYEQTAYQFKKEIVVNGSNIKIEISGTDQGEILFQLMPCHKVCRKLKEHLVDNNDLNRLTMPLINQSTKNEAIKILNSVANECKEVARQKGFKVKSKNKILQAIDYVAPLFIDNSTYKTYVGVPYKVNGKLSKDHKGLEEELTQYIKNELILYKILNGKLV